MPTDAPPPGAVPPRTTGLPLPGPSVATLAVGAFGRLTAAASRVAEQDVPRAMWQRFTAAHVAVYRQTGGRVMGWFDRAPILLLTTTGRRSGRPRTTPLIFVPGGEPAVIASNGGARRHPQWFRNLEATPEAEIEIGAGRHRVRAEVATGPERERIWRRAAELYPGFDRYRRVTDREIPVVVLRPA